MVSQSQIEIKNLLTKQKEHTHYKCTTALLVAGLAAIITPLNAWQIPNVKIKHQTEIINLISLLGGIGCCTYAYIASGKLREYSGKLTMFNQLEKERFIQEQVIIQEMYLLQVKQQYQHQNYQEQNQLLPIDVDAQEMPSTQPARSPHARTHDTEMSALEDLQENSTQPARTHETVIPDNLTCYSCGGSDFKRNGKNPDGSQRLKCKNCGTEN